MLLSVLNRKEKLKFLDLALHMIVVDGEPTEIEKRLLEIMIAEVGDGIVKEYSYELSSDVNVTKEFFMSSSVPVRNTVYMNLFKLTLNDDFYNTSEHFFLEDIREQFGITETKKKQILKVLYAERDLRELARRVINE